MNKYKEKVRAAGRRNSEGLKRGMWTYYRSSDGSVKAFGIYSNGKKEGFWTFYTPLGEILIKSYVNGVIV